MNKKLLIIISFFFFLSVFNYCKCPPERYFDFNSIEVRVDNIIIPQNGKLEMRIIQTDIIHLTKRTNYHLDFGGTAYATSVCEPGYDGEKYPVVRVRVSSDSDFNENYLAGNDLTDIIKVNVVRNGKIVLDYLKNCQIDRYTFYNILFIEERPTISKTHIFTVEFEKSNGEIITGISPEITWE